MPVVHVLPWEFHYGLSIPLTGGEDKETLEQFFKDLTVVCSHKQKTASSQQRKLRVTDTK